MQIAVILRGVRARMRLIHDKRSIDRRPIFELLNEFVFQRDFDVREKRTCEEAEEKNRSADCLFRGNHVLLLTKRELVWQALFKHSTSDIRRSSFDIPPS